MFKKLIGTAALCTALCSQIQAQDLVSGAISFNGSGNQRTAKIKIVNQHKSVAKPLRVYIELHTDRDADNPIAQISYSKSRLKGWRTKRIRIRIRNFSYRSGFNLADAKKIVVICDPKNEVNEKNENNNLSQRRLN